MDNAPPTPRRWMGSQVPIEDRLEFALDTMREMSRLGDPQKMVKVYGTRLRQVMRIDGMVTLSRRELEPPKYRITRSSRWVEEVNPWKQQSQLPIFERGFLGELLYGDTAVIIDELKILPEDPGASFLEGFGSAMAIPLFDQGIAMNMVVVGRSEPHAFTPDELPLQVWMSNLFGRATQTLVLADQVREAYNAVDREMKAVADIQRSLLPSSLPKIPTLDLAAHYQTSHRAGGDYYDFFPLVGGQWGMLIADVSGHGTPAAVLMAVTHSIAHLACDPPEPATKLLAAVNKRLAEMYTNDTGSFVTAFYAIYDPADGTLDYANAGHPPPRIRRASGKVEAIEGAGSLPLGIIREEPYHPGTARLYPGDTLILYTDGITEARAPDGELFDDDRLDALLQTCDGGAQQVIAKTLWEVERFTNRAPATDDRTIVAAKVHEEN